MELVIVGEIVDVVTGEKKNYVKVDDRGEYAYRQISMPKDKTPAIGTKGLLIFHDYYCGAGKYGVYMGASSVTVEKSKVEEVNK